MRLHNRQPVVRIRHDVRHLYAYGVCEGILACLAYIALPAIGWTSDFVLIAGYGMGGCALCRISQGLRRKLGLRELTRARPLSRTVAWIDDLKTRLGQADRLYIGEGFTWGPEHTQAYHEVYELAEKRVLLPMDRQARDAGGLPYIHGINALVSPDAEQPQIHLLPEHTAIIGTTGIGKTRTFELLIAQSIRQGHPVIIVDPKSDRDLLDATYQICKESGRERGFEYFSLAHPQISATMNPFANYSTPGEIAGRITTIMPNNGNSQPFIDFCYDVLTTVVDVLILINIKPSLRALYHYAVLDRESLLIEARTFLVKANISDAHKYQLAYAIRDLEAKVDHDKTHFQKMTTSLLPVLKSLSSGNIGELLNPAQESLSWEKIIQNNLVVYLSLASMKDSYVSSNVGKLFIQDLVSYIGTLYTRQSTFKMVYLYVDETYSVIYEGFVDSLNKMRAAGLHLVLGLQTTADIEARISDAVRRQMYGLISNKLYMRIPDGEQAAELVETLGKCSIPKMTVTRNVAAGLKGPEELFRSGYAVRLDMAETELLPPEVLTSLPRGQGILITQGQPPVKLRIPLLDRNGLPQESFFDRVTSAYAGMDSKFTGDARNILGADLERYKPAA